jgi:hypothetical protein
MKKISFVSAMALAAVSLIGIVPAQAAQVDTIAIIDSYFDKSLPGTHICVADSKCDLTPTDTNSTTFAHGTEMARIILKNNPSANLVYIRAGSLNVRNQIVFPNGREISRAFEAVPNNVSVVSISIFNNGNGVSSGTSCKPSNTGLVAVGLELSKTQSAINRIVSRGGSVIAAAGNGRGVSRVDYPACLPNVVAVARGSQNSGFLTQGAAHPEMDVAVISKTSDVGSLRTTSGLTAALASKWNLTKSLLTKNSKQFLVLDVVN